MRQTATNAFRESDWNYLKIKYVPNLYSWLVHSDLMFRQTMCTLDLVGGLRQQYNIIHLDPVLGQAAQVHEPVHLYFSHG